MGGRVFGAKGGQISSGRIWSHTKRRWAPRIRSTGPPDGALGRVGTLGQAIERLEFSTEGSSPTAACRFGRRSRANRSATWYGMRVCLGGLCVRSIDPNRIPSSHQLLHNQSRRGGAAIHAVPLSARLWPAAAANDANGCIRNPQRGAAAAGGARGRIRSIRSSSMGRGGGQDGARAAGALAARRADCISGFGKSGPVVRTRPMFCVGLRSGSA